MTDEAWVTVVRAWSQSNPRSGLLIRMMHADGPTSCDRHFATVDEAVEQFRRWLIQFERSVDLTIEPNTNRRVDDAAETND